MDGQVRRWPSFKYLGAHSIFYWQNIKKKKSQLNEEYIVVHPLCWLHHCFLYITYKLNWILLKHMHERVVCSVWEHVWWNARFHTHSQTESQANWSTNNEHSIKKEWQNNYCNICIWFLFYLSPNQFGHHVHGTCVCVCVRAFWRSHFWLMPLLVIVNLDLHKIFRDAFVCALNFITKWMHLSMQLVDQNRMRNYCRFYLVPMQTEWMRTKIQ